MAANARLLCDRVSKIPISRVRYMQRSRVGSSTKFGQGLAHFSSSNRKQEETNDAETQMKDGDTGEEGKVGSYVKELCRNRC